MDTCQTENLAQGYKISCSQENINFIMLINVEMPTIVGILTFISMINTTSASLKSRKSLFFSIIVFMSS